MLPLEVIPQTCKEGDKRSEPMLRRDVFQQGFLKRPRPPLRGSTCRNPQRLSKTSKLERVSVHPCPEATTR